ncbi:MAG: hypothetical protein A4E36_02169 [Methanoregulaceae archaeon PtaB.Bin009]|nr:MAG: hypothetical protein A4E36_02169 [Methanoregulaceae archaeon PtaB.Bin009]
MMPSTSVSQRESILGVFNSNMAMQQSSRRSPPVRKIAGMKGFFREFIAERRGSAGISTGRANKIIFTLICWRRFLPPFAELRMADIYTGIEAMRAG